MKVVLQKPVDKLGTPGQVVEVADGYARNFLVPRGLALPATKGSVKHAERLERAHGQKVARERSAAEEQAATLGAAKVRLAEKAGEGGRLFGSVTAAEIATELERLTGVKVDRRHVRLDEAIKSVGTHEIVVHLVGDVNATVTVEVVPA